MITIAVADFNQTYRQGLKTMLEQVEGFEVVLLPVSEFFPEVLNILSIDVLLVDEDLFDVFKTASEKKEMVWPAKKTIVMTMDCQDISAPARGVEAICKGAGKREFAEKIMKLNMYAY
jgi:hypothetical protein